MHLWHWRRLLLQILYGQTIGKLLLLLRLRMWLEVLLLLLLDLLRRLDRCVRWRRLLLLHLIHAPGRVGGRVVALDALLVATLAGLIFLTLQMEASTGFAGLRDTAVLDDGRLGLRVVLGVTKSMAFQQIRAGKGFGADLALVRFLLGVHSHVATQVIKARIALGALATRIEAGGGSSWLLGAAGLLGVLRVGSIAVGGGSGRGVVVGARTLECWFSTGFVGGSRGRAHAILVHGFDRPRSR